MSTQKKTKNPSNLNLNESKKRKLLHQALLFVKDFPNDNKTFLVGDMITFYSGCNYDIKYEKKVIGTHGTDIYVLWDCYWAPIEQDKRTRIKKVN